MITKDTPAKVAFIGCGNISNAYANSVKTRPELVTIHGATDVLPERAAEFVKQHGGKVYASIEAVLADPEVDIVLNLTIHQVHYKVTKQALLAGKHVWSEKPLTGTPKEAADLVATAKKKKVRLGSSPMTFMGEAQQTAWKLLREDRIGKVRMAYAEMNWGRIEVWHPNPVAFFSKGAGPLFDVGVYPLTVLTTILGPVARVQGIAETLLPRRASKTGAPFKVTTPDWVLGILHFKNGVKARITTSFYSRTKEQQATIEFHGDKGFLHVPSSHNFDVPVSVLEVGKSEWQTVPHLREPFKGVEWGRGLFEMIESIQNGRPHRATGDQAAHVVEICSKILESAAKKSRILPLKTRFQQPTPMEWAG